MFEPPVLRLLEQYKAGATRPLDPSRLPQIREAFSARAEDRGVADGVRVEDIEAGGVPVRLYRPEAAGPLPLHLYCHGGAFILGSAMSGECDGMLSRRAAASRCVVASVEYRLAPEHRWPTGVEDCYAALADLVSRAGPLGLAPSAVSIGGRSSGGNFAAVVALMARDRGGPALALQLLEIAGTDLTKSTFAWRNPGPGADTTRERDLALIDLYMDLADRAAPYASPLFARDLAGVAPAYVMSAEFDPRRDECEAYVVRLRDAGIQAVARIMPGHVHGSDGLPNWAPAAAWQAEANAVLARANEAAIGGGALVLEAI